MKRLCVLRVVAAATLACAAAEATAADMANPTGFMYYGYGQGSFGYTGAGAAPGAPGPGAGPAAPGPEAAYAYGNPAPGYAPAAYGAYPGYGYGGGYAGGYGGYGAGGRHCRRRGHCCSFGGNCGCCNNAWDTYCGPGCAEGAGCCGAAVKVHRRHRPLGCGAGPCVDAACDAGPHARRHARHNRRRGNQACGPVEINYAVGAPGGAGAMYGGSAEGGAEGAWQPYPAQPRGGEPIEPPRPSFESEDEPQPMPADDSST